MKDVRERLGMTQAQLAEALGISTRTVATYEAGAEPPKAIRLACLWLEHEATANAPAPDDDDLPEEQPADDGGAAWQAAVDGIVARLNRNDEVLNQWHDLFKGHLAKLGQRLQMLELRAGKAAPSLSESDIGMIARRAARSVLPE